MRIDGQGSNWIRRSTRQAIYHRDGDRCVYCQRKVRHGRGTKGVWAAHLDHLHPQELGGASTADNLVTCCRDCNTAKGSMPLRDFLKSLAAKSLKVKAPTAVQVKAFTKTLSARIRTCITKPLDRVEGRRRADAGM